MKKQAKEIARELISKHTSYIDSMQEAIDTWRGLEEYGDKVLYMEVIGAIGIEINRIYKILGM